MTDSHRNWFDDGSHDVAPLGPQPEAPPEHPEWFDDEAGPLVRLFAMTAGRARPTSESFDLIAIIHAAEPPEDAPPFPSPEHAAIVSLCRVASRSVADVAADSDLPVGVVRVLLGDLLDAGHISVGRPLAPAQLPDERILREVINGLRAL
ncbi:DUF742 domain-containing protein [Streptomyces bathyalis]|uniref:DUF742 domain-containing protein n=1 Tax=Streptomyces bathyalis TaxID=2710756 RepID=A0A7T1T7I2_9ACTN|nr:DUF742 domain-containing protein [Streptomyces bathyalis]QPP07801.1 DUF742 domain-containing protein [Streptomyces bathyalis]